ncbi:MAG: sigma-70 family RNA polymerase sigma factor [Nostoc sp.]|uniref:RNA polymerase sigma factor n=1 Tax=Nostoc sp. TaxID=1180 RepID=UPI002FF68B94
MVVSQTVFSSSGRSSSDDFSEAFWQLWEQYRDELYRRCIKWIGGNPTDAEDALSRAMLKAWEKVQQYAGKITNFKAWLTTLTRNLCMDIHRERSRGANRVEDIEGYASGNKPELVQSEDTPESAMETDEKRIVIRRAIDNLPIRLRETFILHFYQELSHQEIVEQQGISYQNVCKRISQARTILREELREYFIGEDETGTDLSVPPTAMESEIGEMSEGNGGVEARVGETVLAVAVEEVEIVGGEESPEVARNVQQSKSVMVVATSEGKLEVRSDRCRCVEVALFELLLAPILALAQLDEEIGTWGNSFLAVQRRQQQHQVGKGWGGVLRSSRSPPWYCFPNCKFLERIYLLALKIQKYLLQYVLSREVIKQHYSYRRVTSCV